MNFLKEHVGLRMALILVFFALGVALTLVGWSMTGQMKGLLIMLAGVVCLLAALLIYNKPYSGKA